MGYIASKYKYKYPFSGLDCMFRFSLLFDLFLILITMKRNAGVTGDNLIS